MDWNLLKESPFFLNDEQISWVRATQRSMSEKEKIGQLFCLTISEKNWDMIAKLTDEYHAGGFMCRAMQARDILEIHDFIHQRAKIPMLSAANYECGADGVAKDATDAGSCLQIGATGDEKNAYLQGQVCAAEGVALGTNWAFAPVVDLEYNWRNPIVGTRAYGKEPDFVAKCGAAYIRAVQERGMAASAKHFPGDGLDERDQHLVTTINSFSCEEWEETYGKVYRACIEAGVMTVMIGHIMQPAWSKRLNPGLADEQLLPATCSKELLKGLLRDRLHFNGMIVTDATNMCGAAVLMDRRKMLPAMIEAGCDMLLFAVNTEEDMQSIREALYNGDLSHERFEDAVTRILALKAALNLPQKQRTNTLMPDHAEAKRMIGCEAHRDIDRQIADQSVTLVKDTQHLLPINPQKYPRIYLYVLAEGKEPNGKVPGVSAMMKEKLEAQGYQVTIHDSDLPLPPFGEQARYDQMMEQADLILYCFNLATYSNKTTVRIDWKNFNYPTYPAAVPTLAISFANPYHLVDIPRIRTLINAYKFKESTVDAVLEKVQGKSPFKGISPVDPFCGFWDAHL